MPKKTQRGVYLGIDLGTTNSKGACLDWRDKEGGQPEVLSILQHEEQGKIAPWTALPSVVQFDTDGKSVYVGEYPRRHLTDYPDRSIRSVKRLMGTNWRYSIPGWSGLWTPESVSGLLLKHIRDRALEALHVTTNDLGSVAISVPASFSSRQRKATEDAARLAGFSDDVRLIDEPSAALIHYLHKGWQDGRDFKPSARVLVFDMGGGTLDVSLANVKARKSGPEITILSRSRYTELAGTEFDLRLAAYIVTKLASQGIAVPEDERSRKRLYSAVLLGLAEPLKQKMSRQLHNRYRWDYTVDGDPFEASVADLAVPVSPESRELILGNQIAELPDVTVTFNDFDKVLRPFLQPPQADDGGGDGAGTVYGPIMTALEAARLHKGDIDTVLLHGGMTLLPLIRAAITSFFPTSTHVESTPSPMTSVAQGAAIYHAALDGRVGEIKLNEPPLFESVFLEKQQGFQKIVDVNEHRTKDASRRLDVTFDRPVRRVVLSFYHGFREDDPLLTLDQTAELSLESMLPAGTPLQLSYTVEKNRTLTYSWKLPDDDEWRPLAATKVASAEDKAGQGDVVQSLRNIQTK